VRIYEGAPRHNYQDILRSVGAILDERGMREITLAETDDGFMVQGLVISEGENRSWNDPGARQAKETFHLRDDDIARLMDEAVARRKGRAPLPAGGPQRPTGFYEPALRVLGAYVDQQQPRDVFFFEQDHQFVMRLLTQTRAGLRHVLVEFTREEVEAMIASALTQRPTPLNP
jgi:hypothetical protein